MVDISLYSDVCWLKTTVATEISAIKPTVEHHFVGESEANAQVRRYLLLTLERSRGAHEKNHPTIRYMVYNGYYKVMSNIPKMGQLPTPDFSGMSGWRESFAAFRGVRNVHAEGLPSFLYIFGAMAEWWARQCSRWISLKTFQRPQKWICNMIFPSGNGCFWVSFLAFCWSIFGGFVWMGSHQVVLPEGVCSPTMGTVVRDG